MRRSARLVRALVFYVGRGSLFRADGCHDRSTRYATFDATCRNSLGPAVDQAHVHVVLQGRARGAVALLERLRRSSHRLAVQLIAGIKKAGILRARTVS